MHLENKYFLIEKIISCSIVLSLIFLLPPNYVWDCVIVIGLAHFALSYLYQYKAGKIKKRYLAPYSIMLLIVFYMAFNYTVFFTVLVTAFFLLHYFFDEFKLRQEKPSIEYFSIILILVVMLSGWSFDFLTGGNVTPLLTYLSIAISCFCLALKAFIGRIEVLWNCSYLWFLLCLLGVFLTMEFTGHRPHVNEGVGFIILLHCITWYIRLGMRFKKDCAIIFRSYLRRVLLTNFIFILGYYIVVIEGERQGFFYDGVYHPIGFYIWSFMHLITTFRLSDYRSAFNFSKVSA